MVWIQLRWVHKILGLEMSSTLENTSIELGMFLVWDAVLSCYKGTGGEVEHRGCLGAVSWVLKDSAAIGFKGWGQGCCVGSL